jgi:hypothetical protein
MPCDELLQLRSQATQIKIKINDQRRKARAKAAEPRAGRPSGKSEYVPYLQRKLSRLASKIEAHMAAHRCQE